MVFSGLFKLKPVQAFLAIWGGGRDLAYAKGKVSPFAETWSPLDQTGPGSRKPGPSRCDDKLRDRGHESCQGRGYGVSCALGEDAVRAKLALIVLAILVLSCMTRAQAVPTPSDRVGTASQTQAKTGSQDKPAEDPQAKPAPAPKWFDHISLSGFLAGDGRWRRAGDNPAAFASEPGAVRRSTTLNVGSYLSVPFYEHIELAAEFMKALRRDDVPGLGRSFRETALSATLSYVLVTPEMMETSGRNYRARRSRRFAHPAVAAVRFEALDDGGRAGALGTWSVKHRMSAGGRYAFYTHGNIEAAMTLEYRRQTIRVSPVFAGPVPEAHEVYLRFGLDF